MRSNSCPGIEDLRGWLLGHSPEEVARRIDEHFASCEECRRLVETIDTKDQLVETLRGRSGYTPLPITPTVMDLIERNERRVDPDRKRTDLLDKIGWAAEFIPIPGAAWNPEREIGQYRLLRLLGEGGMGQVWEAEDQLGKRRLAVKMIRPELMSSPDAARRFLNEARAGAAIRHQNVVEIWSVGEHLGCPYFTMPLLEGESLATRLERERLLPAGLAVRVARDVAAGLAAVHDKGLIHRDVKPGNVWLEGNRSEVRRALLLDFGLVYFSPGAGYSVSTVAGAIRGTPAYMALEQLRGDPFDHRADLFSLGLILYEMLTGERPPGGFPLPHWEEKAGIEERLAGLVNRLLAPRPDDRPSSALRVLVELDPLAARPV